jgi:hypothetical protein
VPFQLGNWNESFSTHQDSQPHKECTDAKAKEVCKPLGLSVRGTGGEHTPIGSDGTVDISPSALLFIKEKEIIDKLYQGIEKLMAIENA